MSVRRKSAPAEPRPDLESTAELPVLDVASYEATQSIDASEFAEHVASLEATQVVERLSSTDTWIAPASFAADLAESAARAATVEQQRGELETKLQELSRGLDDVEGRLVRKGQRLSEIERQLEESRAEYRSAGERIVGLQDQLDAALAARSAAETNVGGVQSALDAAQAARQALEARVEALVGREQELIGQLARREHELTDQFAAREKSSAGLHSAALREASDKLSAREADLQQQLAALERDLRTQLSEQKASLVKQLAEQESGAAARYTARDQELSARLSAQESAAAQRLAQIEAQSAARDAERNTQSAQHSADYERRVVALQREIEDRAAREAQQLETLHTFEGRRVLFDDALLALEQEIGERSSRISALEQELLVRERRNNDLEQQLAAHLARVGALEGDVSRIGKALSERDFQLDQTKTGSQSLEQKLLDTEAQRSRAEDSVRAFEARVAEQTTELSGSRKALDAALARQREVESELAALRREQSDAEKEAGAALQISSARVTELENDLRVAEESIAKLETDGRAKAARIEEIVRTGEEWRTTLEEARASLEKRDEQIRKLEAGAAHSAALVGNIEKSIRRLDPLGITGPHELVPEGLTRLLIRTDGESEVVHVLGRRTTIGRTAENDLRIDASYISRHHAVILAGPTSTVIEDLNSTNGVLINNRRITRQTLKDGDLVMVGKTKFRFATRQVPDRR